MQLKRRDFLKATAGGGLLLAAQGPVAALAHKEKKALAPNAVGILYDSTLCVGCMACMAGCKQANNMPVETTDMLARWDNPPDLSAKTLNVIKRYIDGNGLNKDQETDGYGFIKRHCMHCLDPSCVSACPVSALQKDPDNGVVSYDKNACIGCRYCQIACPFNIPKFEWHSAFPKIFKCELCRHILQKGGISGCCSSCPTGASIFGPVDELLTEAKRRLTLAPGLHDTFPVNAMGAGRNTKYNSQKVGHYVPHIYGENEVGGTQVLLLAGIPFGKLGMPDLPEESFVSLADGIQYAIYKGMAYPLIVLGALVYMISKGESPKE